MRKAALGFLLLAVLLFVEPYIGKERISLGLEQNRKVTMSNFILRFLGQFRYTIASYLWMDVEIYHHELGLTGVTSRIGTGNPKKIGEILGLCQLVTRLDPHFIPAYDVGAWRLISSLGKFKPGFRYLEKGISHNPDSARLYDTVGTMYFFDLHNCPKAIPYLNKAVQIAETKLPLGQRYKFIQSDDLQILGHCYEMVGSKRKAIQTWKKVLKILPGYGPALIRIQKLSREAQPR